MAERSMRLLFFLGILGALEVLWHFYMTTDLPGALGMKGIYVWVDPGGKPVGPFGDWVIPSAATGVFIGLLRPQAKVRRQVAEVCTSAAYIVAVAVACWLLPGLRVPWLPGTAWQWVGALLWDVAWALGICFFCAAGVELDRGQRRTRRQERISDLSKRIKGENQDHDKPDDREPSSE